MDLTKRLTDKQIERELSLISPHPKIQKNTLEKAIYMLEWLDKYQKLYCSRWVNATKIAMKRIIRLEKYNN